ncbi:MAG: hypothetical protein ABR568_13365 [Pyrinomonadaceae bacterium]
MKNQHTVGIASLIGIVLLSLGTPVFSQAPGPPPIDKSTNPERARQQDLSRREYQLRNFGNQPGRTPDRRQLEALMAQTEQDFNRILTLHNEIARAISSNQDLDYHFVSDATAEIRKKASRLQTTLGLHDPNKEPQNTKEGEKANSAQLKPALFSLCKHIKNFVTNPVIETPATVNAEQLTRARRDLESLIQLSEQIKKDADKLSKTRKL